MLISKEEEDPTTRKEYTINKRIRSQFIDQVDGGRNPSCILNSLVRDLLESRRR